MCKRHCTQDGDQHNSTVKIGQCGPECLGFGLSVRFRWAVCRRFIRYGRFLLAWIPRSWNEGETKQNMVGKATRQRSATRVHSKIKGDLLSVRWVHYFRAQRRANCSDVLSKRSRGNVKCAIRGRGRGMQSREGRKRVRRRVGS